MTAHLLEVNRLTIRFPGTARNAVELASFHLEQGEVAVIIGESGAGKTTLARALAGRLSADVDVSGQVLVLGSVIATTGNGNPSHSRRPLTALISQEPELNLSPMLRIGNQIEEVLGAGHNYSATIRRRRTDELLHLVGLSPNLREAYPHRLSGGERQRVVIAQALASNPALLIADEFTSALDCVAQAAILGIFRQLAKNLELAILVVMHDAAALPGFADRVLVMDNGRIVETGETDQVFKSPRHRQTRKLLDAIVAGPEMGSVQRSLESKPGEMAVQVASLRKTYTVGEKFFGPKAVIVALDHVDLEFKRGSILALIGKSGSGKTTLARCLASFEAPDSGEMMVDGQIVRPPSRFRGLKGRRNPQLLWQHSALALNPRLPVIESAAEPLLLASSYSRWQALNAAMQMLERLGLPPMLHHRRPLQLSGGQRQRVALARALLIRPSVLILDEAFAGLDLAIQSEIGAMLLELRDAEQIAILFITHDLRRASALADEIAVMDKGRIVEKAEPAQLFYHPNHAASSELVRATMSQA